MLSQVTEKPVDMVQTLREPIDGPIVLDCRIDPSPRGEWVELLYLHAPGATEPA